jgi:hypothetical protein
MSLRGNSKYQSPSPVKGYSPTKLSTNGKNSGLNIATNPSLKNSSSKGMRSGTDFSKHLKNIQNQADENIEDEYIKNLQQQIAYMELELKLLKEKELEQKQSVSQIDKFFNDGVPLNENILALKNQYNHAKKTMENKIDDVNDMRLIEMKIAADLKAQYEKNTVGLATIKEATDKKEVDFAVNLNELRMAYLNEKHKREDFEKEFKKQQALLKAKNTENLGMIRDLEKESLLVHHREEMLKNMRLKTTEDLKAKEKWMISLDAEVVKKRSMVTSNPELTIFANENLELNSKLLKSEKETNLAIAKVKEMEMFLETRSKERELEADLKRTLVAKISQVKFYIEEQNKINEIEIKEKVEAKEEKEKKDLEKEIQEFINQKETVKQRQKLKEDHIEEMAQDKMGLQQDVMTLEQDTSSLEKEVKEFKDTLLRLKNSKEGLTLEEKDLKEKLHPLITYNSEMKTMIPNLENDNIHLKEQIAHMEKLNELSLQIKNVNLEDLKLLTQSNDQVQVTITDLMRKWDFLQRMGGMAKAPQ